MKAEVQLILVENDRKLAQIKVIKRAIATNLHYLKSLSSFVLTYKLKYDSLAGTTRALFDQHILLLERLHPPRLSFGLILL
jgi:hypothetical protein